MYRSGWGTKEDQEVTLALRVRRAFFDSLLAAGRAVVVGPRPVRHRGGVVAGGRPVVGAAAVGPGPPPVRGQAGAAGHPARAAGRGAGGVRAAGAGRGHRPVGVRGGAAVAVVVGRRVGARHAAGAGVPPRRSGRRRPAAARGVKARRTRFGTLRGPHHCFLRPVERLRVKPWQVSYVVSGRVEDGDSFTVTQVESVLRGDDLGGDARVEAVPLDQRSLGSRRLPHAALGMSLADELGILRHPHSQLGPLELQRLGHVVADELPRTMLGALLLFRRDVRDHFIARQMLGQFLAADFARLAASCGRRLLRRHPPLAPPPHRPARLARRGHRRSRVAAGPGLHAARYDDRPVGPAASESPGSALRSLAKAVCARTAVRRSPRPAQRAGFAWQRSAHGTRPDRAAKKVHPA